MLSRFATTSVVGDLHTPVTKTRVNAWHCTLASCTLNMLSIVQRSSWLYLKTVEPTLPAIYTGAQNYLSPNATGHSEYTTMSNADEVI